MGELERLARNAEALVREGYYDVSGGAVRAPPFLGVLGSSEQPSDVIVEIKYRSPNMDSGKDVADFDGLLPRIVRAGALGLSVLAEPRIFGGDLGLVRKASAFGVPVLFKDIVVDPRQVTAAAAVGASTVLLIQSLAPRGLLRHPIQRLIDEAHDLDLDVVLEAHTPEEFEAARATDADILGINNRDLDTMAMDLGTTPRILSALPKDRPVIAMSGLERRDQVEAMLRAGADAVLVGTSVMAHPDPQKKLEELIHG